MSSNPQFGLPQFGLPLEFGEHEAGEHELEEQGLREQLCKLTGRPVTLSLTTNRVSVLSAREAPRRRFSIFRGRGEGGISLRLHRIFLKAGPDVVSELARFITNREKGVRFPLLARFIKQHGDELRENKKRKENRISLRPRGRFHDLGEIFDSVNAEYFEGRLACGITWGKRPPPRPVRKRTLGSFSVFGEGAGACGPARGLIRINPVLDRKNIPAFYVRFVVYHEMLHADIGILVVGQANGRRRVHTPLFRKRERLFRDFERAMAFERGPGR